MQTTQQSQSRSASFVTRVVHTLADGHRYVHLSRRHRKGLPPLHLIESGARAAVVAAARSPWLRFFAPRRLAWWIAVLFIIGSSCFALGSLGSNWPHALPPGMADGTVLGLVFFVGSLFFTSAAGLQLLEATNGDLTDLRPEEPHRRPAWRWFAWKPHNAGWLASLIQFIGTLLFNLNTGDAMIAGLDWVQEDIAIWVPNMAGSICFLAASYLALVEFSHGWWSFEPRQVAWWIVMVNLMGSVAFQISALYDYFPASPVASWVWIANLWTLIGALCFLFASYLLIPESFDADAAVADPGPSNALSME